MPLLAVIVIGNVPPTVGIPLSRPDVGLSVTPFGRFPVSVKLITAGIPEAVTVNDPNIPSGNFALLPLVISGAWPRFNTTVQLAVTAPVVYMLPLSVPAAHVPPMPAMEYPLFAVTVNVAVEPEFTVCTVFGLIVPWLLFTLGVTVYVLIAKFAITVQLAVIAPVVY